METSRWKMPSAEGWTGADPRVKISCIAAITGVLLAARMSLSGQLVMVLFGIALLMLTQGGGRSLARTALRLVPLLILVVALNGIAVRRGEAALRVGGWMVLSREGLDTGVYLSVRLAAMILAVVALVRATPAMEFARATYDTARVFSTRIAERLALQTFLAMSFVPLFAAEFRRIEMAQSFRQGGPRRGSLRRMMGMRSVLVPLVLSAVHRSERLATVVELRHLEGRVGLAFGSHGLGMADAALVVVTVVALVAAFLV